MTPIHSQNAPASARGSNRRNRRSRPAWSLAEERTLAKEHALHGNTWQRIANSLPGRSVGEVKNIYHSTLRSTRHRKRSLLRAYITAVRGHEADPEARSRALREVEAAHRDSHHPQPRPQLAHRQGGKSRPSSPSSASPPRLNGERALLPPSPGTGLTSSTAGPVSRAGSVAQHEAPSMAITWRQSFGTDSEAPATPPSQPRGADSLLRRAASVTATESSSMASNDMEVTLPGANFLRLDISSGASARDAAVMHQYDFGTEPSVASSSPLGCQEASGTSVTGSATQQQGLAPHATAASAIEGWLPPPRLLPPQPEAGAALGPSLSGDQQRSALPAVGGPVAGAETRCLLLEQLLLPCVGHCSWLLAPTCLQHQQMQQQRPGPVVAAESQLQSPPQSSLQQRIPRLLVPIETASTRRSLSLPPAAMEAGVTGTTTATAAASRHMLPAVASGTAAVSVATTADVVDCISRGPMAPRGTARGGCIPTAMGTATTSNGNNGTRNSSMLEVLLYLYDARRLV